MHPIYIHTTVSNTTTTYTLYLKYYHPHLHHWHLLIYTCALAVVPAFVFTEKYPYYSTYIYTYILRSRSPPYWMKIKRGKKGNSIWGWKNIGFYGDFRRRMQSKHNSHVYIPPWFYWIAGLQSCHKGHKMAVLFILVSPWLLWNDVSEVFWITSLRGGNATRAALASPPPTPYTIFYTYIYICIYINDDGGGVCCFLFPHENYSHYFLYIRAFVYFHFY